MNIFYNHNDYILSKLRETNPSLYRYLQKKKEIYDEMDSYNIKDDVTKDIQKFIEKEIIKWTE